MTIQEISKRAGVSTATVSLTINRVSSVHPSLARRVHLLWLGAGTNEPERMRTGLQRLHASLLQANIQHVFYESRGTDHEWQTWRRDLKDFAPPLCRQARQ